MAKITLPDITSGYYSTTALNQAFTDIETAIENTVSRDGTAPNNMSGDLDMNSNRITNLPEPLNLNEAARLQDVINASNGDLSANLIANTPAGTISATTVQAAINELDSDVTAHLADTTDAHAASAITNTPAGNIAATTVQAAINELDTEKQPLDATLTALAGLATGADQLAYSTGTDTFSQTSLTSFARTILDDTDAATVRTTTGTEPTLLTETSVTGAAVTSLQFTGLDINTHKQYTIEFDWYNPVANASLSLYINNNTTATNYYTQVLNIDNVTLTGARTNASSAAAMNSTARGRYEIRLSLVSDGTNAYPAIASHGSYDSSTAQTETIRTVSSTTAVANITQIDLVSTIASSIGIGSTVRIYRGDK